MNKESTAKNTGFNWGKGLLIVIVLFICTTLGVVAFLLTLDYEVVTKDYYKKAEQYQQHIEQVEHTSTLSEPVAITLLTKKDIIEIRFPSSLTHNLRKGTIELYRPSNAKLDQKIKLALNEQGVQHIPSGPLAPGKWSVKIRWTADNKKYFKEKTLFL